MDYNEELLNFFNNCPTPFQFAEVASRYLLDAGFTQVDDRFTNFNDTIKKGFVIREKRALVAFNIGGYESAIIVGTHCDSPVLKLDPVSESAKCSLKTVTCATYGGGIWTTWQDRPLRLAGCVVMKDGSVRTFDSIEPVAVAPSLAIHLGSTSIDENNNNVTTPIFGLSGGTSLMDYVASKLGVQASDIATHELSFVDANPPKIVGVEKQFLATQRIDNLASTFAALKAFLNSEPNNTINVLVVFDYEEIGSNTSTGAKGDFLKTVLRHLVPDVQKYHPFISKSLLVSSDNAHAVHPNYGSKHEAMHAPIMGSGVIIKKSPGVQYATDMASTFPLKKAAEAAGVELHYLINRNDIPSGSTIGPLASTQLGIATVDIGQPQLAMHSIREFVTVDDIKANTKLLVELYNHYEEYRYRS